MVVFNSTDKETEAQRGESSHLRLRTWHGEHSDLCTEFRTSVQVQCASPTPSALNALSVSSALYREQQEKAQPLYKGNLREKTLKYLGIL